jgi:hypothetical protein
MGDETMGMDIGPSTIAMVSDTKVELKEFCEKVVKIDKEKRVIQRRLDRQRKANNPQHYNVDGTIKKGKKVWKNSKRYIKTKNELAEMERKLAETRKMLHGWETNRVIERANTVKLEKLSYKAFQKLYGKSVGRKAPSMFVKMLKRKMMAYGGTVQEFSTYSTKLSQTCLCGTIKKKRLKDRWHVCECGIHAQRDLFSAFLAKHVTKSHKLSLKEANKEWDKIKPLLETCVSDLKEMKKERKLISTFGV